MWQTFLPWTSLDLLHIHWENGKTTWLPCFCTLLIESTRELTLSFRSGTDAWKEVGVKGIFRVWHTPFPLAVTQCLQILAVIVQVHLNSSKILAYLKDRQDLLTHIGNRHVFDL